jgi:predicted Zn-dependent protease
MKLDAQQAGRAAFDRAMIALEAGQLDDAADHLRDALALAPDMSEARLAQAQLALDRHEPREAVEALDAHDLYHPDSRQCPAVMLLRAEALCRAGMNDLALKVVQEFAREFPDDIRPHRMLAGLHLTAGDVASCAASLRQVLRLAPSDDAARRALAALIGAFDPQQSVELLWPDYAQAKEPSAMLRVARLLRAAARDREAQEGGFRRAAGVASR